MLRSVAVIVQAPVAVFELGVMAEVFGIDRTSDGVPAFGFSVCAREVGEPLPAGPGAAVTARDPLSATETADLVAVVCSSMTGPPDESVLAAIRSAHHRGAHVLALCTGVFALAHAGVLDGRRVATHWRYAADLAALRPAATVDPDVLYFRDGPVITCAGTASGIDAVLHLVRDELGPAVANRIARRMVVPGFRHGSQRQRLEAVLPADDDDRSVQPLLEWCEDHLDQVITMADLCSVAHISERTLLRRFADQLGTTPHKWLTQRRIARAEELLAHSATSIDVVARQSGFSNAASLRHHFRIVTGTAPTRFRHTVAAVPVPVAR